MTQVRIAPVDAADVSLLFTIDRRERIEQMYSARGGRLVLRGEVHDMKGWPEGEAELYAPMLEQALREGGLGLGAFDGDRLIGAFVLAGVFMGDPADQLQLKFLHVGRDARRKGLGCRLWGLAVDEAMARGARRLYVSATPSRPTVEFYLHRGCHLAPDPDPALFDLEPEDIHLEYLLPTTSDAR